MDREIDDIGLSGNIGLNKESRWPLLKISALLNLILDLIALNK